MPREIPKPWDAFLKDLDRSLEEPVEFHCLGGFVVTMMYGLVATSFHGRGQDSSAVAVH